MNLGETDLLRLASFPEQNPNPVIEISAAGTITYNNPAATRHFPDLPAQGFNHPLFRYVKEKFTTQKQELNNFTCEVQVNSRIYEQKLFYIESIDVIRVYSSDITQQKETEKKLANLALFPEQNPNPVIEVSSGSRNITYTNPAAIKRFPDLREKGIDHPLLAGVDVPGKKDFQREIEIDEFSFEQKIYFISDSHLIRVYSHDITEQKKIQKNLSRLASFPELNPSPIIEINLKGEITYYNPACLKTFPEVPGLQLQHPVLVPFNERFDMLRRGEIDNYVCEIKINDHYYSQRARYLPENGVIRIFNNDITPQKKNEEIIREKNKDITDSINYARKIQQTILPSEELVHKGVKEYFVLYKPKDIISGDFYWFTPLADHFLVVCADCTGHGVPGALMSMIGSNFISHIVHEKEITSPGTALSELDKRIRKALKQDEEPENRDGMDTAFCSLQVSTKILHYSGANRPLALIRNGELREIEPTKSPVGGQHPGEKKFEDHTIQLQEGDRVYLFSDGITDQFGGPKGKKYMKKRFYEFILSIRNLPLAGQKKELLAEFERWKGELEQTDDVCVIAIGV
jgi:serine phosphatase RsbU (regulator of sigma subunit)/PAS domain-containing protein